MIEEIKTIVQVGFSIFVAVWWMTKGSQVIEKNTEAINALCLQVATCPRKK